MSKTILVVDDQAVMLRIVSAPLQREGYTVMAANSAAEALIAIQKSTPDLIILDIRLPDASGIEVCRTIRQELGLMDTPIMLLSGLTEVETKVEGLQAGADEYVTKPVDPKELVARVNGQLARIERLHQSLAKQPAAAATTASAAGHVIGVIGGKGGVGTSTVVANLGLALARRSYRTVALELRPYYGTLARHLGINPTANLGGLLENAASAINERLVGMYLQPCELGLRAIFGPQQLRDYRDIQPDQVDALVQTLTTLADFTIIDLPHMPSVANRSALRKCNQVVVVVEPDESCVRAAKALLELLRAWNIRDAAIKLFSVNRTQSAHQVSAQDIEKRLEHSLIGVVTAAPDLAVRATSIGSPFIISAPDSLAALTLQEMSERIEQLARGR
ncbi:MAG: response regulator [Litorilinea sp.]